MNFRSTAILFALLLGMLWLFGLTLALKKSRLEEGLIFPTLRAEKPVIQSIEIEKARKNKEPVKIRFTRDKDDWLMTVPDVLKPLRTERSRVNQITKELTDARRDEEADVRNDPALYGLDSPAITVTFTGHEENKPGEIKEWKIRLGRDKAGVVYAITSDRPRQVQAVRRTALDSLYFDDVRSFRSRRLIEFPESAVRQFALTGKDQKPLELEKKDDVSWYFIKPPLGAADYEGPPPGKLEPAAKREEGVKGLLSAILRLRVQDEDDFLPLEDSPQKYGLDAGKETLRIEVRKKDDDGEATAVLLIGTKEKTKDGEVYPVQLEGDPGMARVSASSVEPIFPFLKDPNTLRNHDLLAFDTGKVDALEIRRGKAAPWPLPSGREPTIRLRETDSWYVSGGDEPWRKASRRVLTDVLEALQGKRDVKEFVDDKNKTDKELGLDSPAAVVDLWVDAVETKAETDKKGKDGKDKDKKKDAKAKDDKSDPKLKENAKPVATLSFGKVEGDVVYVKRVVRPLPSEKKEEKKKDAKKDEKKDSKKDDKAAQEIVSRLAVPKAVLEKLTPKDEALAFLDTSLPPLKVGDVVALTLEREKEKGEKKDKVMEKVEVKRHLLDTQPQWSLPGMQDYAGRSFADRNRVERLLRDLASLHVQKWLPKVDLSKDLDTYGLKTPAVTVTLRTKKPARWETAANVMWLGAGQHGPLQMAIRVYDGFTNDKMPGPETVAGVCGLGGGRMAPLQAAARLQAGWNNDRVETVVFKFSKEFKKEAKDKDKDKDADKEGDKEEIHVYAQRTGSDYLFRVPPHVLKSLKEADLRDRAGVPEFAKLIEFTLAGISAAPTALGPYLLASPVRTAAVHRFDAAKAKEVKIVARTPFELRRFAFSRNLADKADKSWVVDAKSSGLEEFTVDSDKVTKFVEELAVLRAEIFTQLKGGAKAEHKFGDKEATFRAEITLEDGKKIILTVGAPLDGVYFAQSSAWEGAVFLLGAREVGQWMEAQTFAKERVAAGD